MKTLLAALTAGCLLLSAGCGSTPALATAGAESDMQATGEVSGSTTVAAEGEKPDPEDGPRPERPENDGRMVRIISVEDGQITVNLADIEGGERGQAPDGGGPSGDRTQPPGDRGEGGGRPDGTPPVDMELPEDGEMPADRPEGDLGGGMPGGGMSFSEESTVYPLADDVTVVKGMGDSATALTIDDIAADDNARIELNDDGEVISILLMEAPEAMEPPPAAPGADADAEE